MTLGQIMSTLDAYSNKDYSMFDNVDISGRGTAREQSGNIRVRSSRFSGSLGGYVSPYSKGITEATGKYDMGNNTTVGVGYNKGRSQDDNFGFNFTRRF